LVVIFKVQKLELGSKKVQQIKNVQLFLMLIRCILNFIENLRMKSKLNILLSFFFIPGFLFSQSKIGQNLSLRLDGHYGFVIPEYQHFNYLVEKPISGLELSLLKKTTGKTIWEQAYKYPEYGLTFSMSTLGNREVFGNEFALYPFVQSFIIRKEKFQLTNQFGLGIGYATKKFDLENNFENISVGSNLNIHFNFKLGTRFILTKRLSINSGLSFSHYSNANMAEPNLGLNLVTAYLGLNYAAGETTEFKKNEMVQFQPNHEFVFIYAAGGKHTRALQSTIYFTSSMSLEYKYQWKRKFHFGGGVDIFYDSATETEMSSPGNSEYKPIYDFRSGIHLSQELVYDRFSFILQEGIYIGLTDHVDHAVMYNRAILRWKFKEHLLLHISMKSHLHILDYPEVGFGYYFTRNK